MDEIIQLFPSPQRELPLHGAYLAHNLRQYEQPQGRPYFYSNYVTSIDGRIAVPATGGGLGVPDAIANDRDWRLFQELAAQADLIISSGRYLRDRAADKAQEILRTDDPRFADLRQWRLDQGLSPQPDIAIISNSLNFPVPDALTTDGRKVVIITSRSADAQRKAAMEKQAAVLITAGTDDVSGNEMSLHLAELGYRTVFNSTGPKVLHLMLQGGALDRLYLTHANRLLGGEQFATIVDGHLLKPPIDVRNNTIYLDPHGLDGLGQLFLSYDIVR
ncbi:MAG: RibD family protein [Candidatus Promineifilaceae bacterium]